MKSPAINFSKIKAFVFDMDGVLVDSEKMYDECWRLASKDFGLDAASMIRLRRKCIGINRSDTEKILSENVKALDPKKFYDSTESYAEKLKLEKKYFASECLSFLKMRNYVLFLASSNSKKYAVKKMAELGLLEFFLPDRMIFSDDVKNAKPAPDIYAECVRRLGFASCECAAVEDSPSGIRSAYDAGLKTVMIPDIIEPDFEIKGKCDLILSNLKDLCDNVELDVKI